MNNFIRSFVFISLGLALGGVICYFAPFSITSSYKDAFIAQYDYYRSIDKPGKILVIGSSSVAFGIDLDVMEAKTGRPCAEMGNDLTMGYSFSTEASKSNLRSGDVVVIELADIKIDGFSTEAILSTIGKRKEMYRYFPPRFWPKVAADYPQYILKSYFYGVVGYHDIVYSVFKFDQRGCMISRGDEKNPPNLDGISKGDVPFTSPDAFSQGLIDYLNEYADYCKSLNVRVFFTLQPYYDEYFDWNTTDKECFSEALSSRLHAPVITNLKDSIYPKKYIWGQEFHLSAEGAKIRSERLVEALKPYLDSELK